MVRCLSGYELVRLNIALRQRATTKSRHSSYSFSCSCSSRFSSTTVRSKSKRRRQKRRRTFSDTRSFYKQTGGSSVTPAGFFRALRSRNYFRGNSILLRNFSLICQALSPGSAGMLPALSGMLPDSFSRVSLRLKSVCCITSATCRLERAECSRSQETQPARPRSTIAATTRSALDDATEPRDRIYLNENQFPNATWHGRPRSNGCQYG